MEDYKEIFNQKIENSFILDIKGHILQQFIDGPTFMKPQQVPYVWLSKVEDELEKAGIN